MQGSKLKKLEGRANLNRQGHGIDCQCPDCGGLSHAEADEVREKFRAEMRRRSAVATRLDFEFGDGDDAEVAKMLLKAYRAGRVSIHRNIEKDV